MLIDIEKVDAARLLARLHAMRAEHVQFFARTDCWEDRTIAALERAFQTVEGPAQPYEPVWVCGKCCAVNAYGLPFCRDCETAKDFGLARERSEQTRESSRRSQL